MALGIPMIVPHAAIAIGLALTALVALIAAASHIGRMALPEPGLKPGRDRET
jgi:TRAP-type C4-dicarboxylate transport system permease small subunit